MIRPPASGPAARTTALSSRCTREEIRDSVSAATTPASRLALVLAAVHAARPKAIRDLCLDGVELGNRRLIIGGRVRPLDDLTRQVLPGWLGYRRTRWPNTANPHVILSQQTALETGPVSKVWLTGAFRRLDATLERLRVGRQLDEALSCGPDPLQRMLAHLETVIAWNLCIPSRHSALMTFKMTTSGQRSNSVAGKTTHSAFAADCSVPRRPRGVPVRTTP